MHKKKKKIKIVIPKKFNCILKFSSTLLIIISLNTINKYENSL